MTIRADVAEIAYTARSISDAVDSTTDTRALLLERDRAIVLRQSCRAVRADLDALDVLTGVAAGSSLLESAIWERQTRQDLLRIEQQAGALIDALGSLLPGGYRQRRYTVRTGDTLQTIARREMGDWQAWTQIVEANRIDPGEALTVGSELVIPEAE